MPKDDIDSNSKDFQLKPNTTPKGKIQAYEEIVIYSYFYFVNSISISDSRVDQVK